MLLGVVVPVAVERESSNFAGPSLVVPLPVVDCNERWMTRSQYTLVRVNGPHINILAFFPKS